MKKSAAQPIEFFRNGMPDREQHRGGSVEQDSTMGPNFAFRSFCPRESCWGVPFPNPACSDKSEALRLLPLSIFTKEMKSNVQNLQHPEA